MSTKVKRVLFALMSFAPFVLVALSCFRSGEFALPAPAALSTDAIDAILTKVWQSISDSTSPAVPYFVSWASTYIHCAVVFCFASVAESLLLWLPRRLEDITERGLN